MYMNWRVSLRPVRNMHGRKSGGGGGGTGEHVPPPPLLKVGDMISNVPPPPPHTFWGVGGLLIEMRILLTCFSDVVDLFFSSSSIPQKRTKSLQLTIAS